MKDKVLYSLMKFICFLLLFLFIRKYYLEIMMSPFQKFNDSFVKFLYFGGRLRKIIYLKYYIDL